MPNTPPSPPIVPAGAAIESASFRVIEERAGDHSHYDPQQWNVVRRLIHTSGDFDFNGITHFHPEAILAATSAFLRGAPLVVDVEMIRAGVTQRRLEPLGVTVYQFNADPQVIALAKKEATTRTVQAVRTAWRQGLLEGGVAAVGNAPTALLEMIRLIKEENLRPALIIGVPVGFISAAESKEALMKVDEVPWISIQGSKGGSTLAVATLHALMDIALGKPH
ncbi:MAG: precorrin-8X methylmutase [Magnetococcales bacterium]|nr:precorrin-8X methylmutase [Magnetococcales bacterium]